MGRKFDDAPWSARSPTSREKAAQATERQAEARKINRSFRPTDPARSVKVKALEAVNKGIAIAASWEKSDVLRALRLNKLNGLVDHQQVLCTRENRRACVLSCMHCEVLIAHGTPHPGKREGETRRGFAMQTYCKTCEVHLCAVSSAALGGQSAFGYRHYKTRLGKHRLRAQADEGQASDAASRSRQSTTTDSGLKRRRPMRVDSTVVVRALDLDREDE